MIALKRPCASGEIGFLMNYKSTKGERGKSREIEISAEPALLAKVREKRMKKITVTSIGPIHHNTHIPK